MKTQDYSPQEQRLKVNKSSQKDRKINLRDSHSDNLNPERQILPEFTTLEEPKGVKSKDQCISVQFMKDALYLHDVYHL